MGVNLSNIDQEDYDLGPSALQINANYTLAPLFYGWGWNLFLTGVVLAWAGTYATQRAKADRLPVRLTVAAAVVFSCATAVANLISIIEHGKDQNRTNDAISLLRGADSVAPLLGGISAVCAQAFFASRCFSLLPKLAQIPFLVVTVTLITASYAGAAGTTIIQIVNHGSTDVTRGASEGAYFQLTVAAYLWLWSGVAVDILIS